MKSKEGIWAFGLLLSTEKDFTTRFYNFSLAPYKLPGTMKTQGESLILFISFLFFYGMMRIRNKVTLGMWCLRMEFMPINTAQIKMKSGAGAVVVLNDRYPGSRSW